MRVLCTAELQNTNCRRRTSFWTWLENRDMDVRRLVLLPIYKNSNALSSVMSGRLRTNVYDWLSSSSPNEHFNSAMHLRLASECQQWALNLENIICTQFLWKNDFIIGSTVDRWANSHSFSRVHIPHARPIMIMISVREPCENVLSVLLTFVHLRDFFAVE